MFNTIDKLLHRNVVKKYPKASSAQELANTFADFFYQKIENIKNELLAQNTAVTNPYADVGECSTEFTKFQLMSEVQIKNFVDSSCHKSCSLDPLPASILKSCTDILLPVITRMVNTSLETATMPTELKNAVLTPNLKKNHLTMKFI